MEFITRRRLEQRSTAAVIRPSAEDSSGETAAQPAAANERASDGDRWDEENLRRLLDAPNTNAKLIRALVALAQNPEHRLSTAELVAAANRGADRPMAPGRAWGGFLARAQTSSWNHFGLSLPLERHSWDGQWTYSMDPEEAEAVCRWAEETHHA
jgi:hypothetical protein